MKSYVMHRGGQTSGIGGSVAPEYAELSYSIPLGEELILVSDMQRSEDSVASGFQTLPFLERNGQYWGSPADDERPSLSLYVCNLWVKSLSYLPSQLSGGLIIMLN